MKHDRQQTTHRADSLNVERTRPCPVCGCVRSRRLYQQRFEQLSEVTFLAGYDVVVCEKCGAGFADRIPAQEVFDAYYRDVSKYEYQYRGGKESESDQQRFGEIASALVEAIPSRDARILDLGCATGGLLAVLRDSGFPNVQGLDPSPGCACAAWELYQIPVFASSLFNVPADPGSYDFIILAGVLEHVEDVKGALEKVRNVLAANGRVYVEVPDGSRLSGRPDAPFQEFSVEHLNFFSTTSLGNLFERNGFRRVSIGHAVRQQNENTICPVACGVYQRTENAVRRLVRDKETERGLARYIRESQSVDSRIRKIIKRAASEREIMVWGTGTHTQRLIATGAFHDVRISAFVDSNPKYQGQRLHGLPVLSPFDLRDRKAPILISSRGFQREIRDQIRGQLQLDNDLILLYDEGEMCGASTGTHL